jgi:hypothetical protein
MEWREIMTTVREVLDLELFTIGDSPLTVGTPRSRRARSDLREAIWWALDGAGITIAFPQLDLHADEPVVAALRGREVA